MVLPRCAHVSDAGRFADGLSPAAGLAANLKLTPGKSFAAGKYAAQNLGYKVGNAVNSLTSLGQR